MKRFILILLAFLMVCPVFAADDDRGLDPTGWWNALWDDSQFCYDLYARSALLRNSLSIGGGLSLGVETAQFRFDFYTQGDYFMTPVGVSGTVAALETDVEVGVSLGWKFLKFWAFNTYLSCDIGYYAQLIIPQRYSSDLMLVNNGLMLRPKLMTELKIAKYYGITIGVYYQFPLFPGYKDYNGFGILLSIL